MTTAREYRLAKGEASCECTRCFYCGNSVALSHEHDHFPVPKSAGGTDVITCCLNCHDLKDRMGLKSWSASAAYPAMAELVGDADCQSIPAVVAIAKAAHEERWSALSVDARLLCGKILRIAHQVGAA